MGGRHLMGVAVAILDRPADCAPVQLVSMIPGNRTGILPDG